jgi:hypothetical protein
MGARASPLSRSRATTRSRDLRPCVGVAPTRSAGTCACGALSLAGGLWRRTFVLQRRSSNPERPHARTPPGGSEGAARSLPSCSPLTSVLRGRRELTTPERTVVRSRGSLSDIVRPKPAILRDSGGRGAKAVPPREPDKRKHEKGDPAVSAGARAEKAVSARDARGFRRGACAWWREPVLRGRNETEFCGCAWRLRGPRRSPRGALRAESGGSD